MPLACPRSRACSLDPGREEEGGRPPLGNEAPEWKGGRGAGPERPVWGRQGRGDFITRQLGRYFLCRRRAGETRGTRWGSDRPGRRSRGGGGGWKSRGPRIFPGVGELQPRGGWSWDSRSGTRTGPGQRDAALFRKPLESKSNVGRLASRAPGRGFSLTLKCHCEPGECGSQVNTEALKVPSSPPPESSRVPRPQFPQAWNERSEVPVMRMK